MNSLQKRKALAVTLLLFISSSVQAQTELSVPSPLEPPRYSAVDNNNVNISGGLLTLQLTGVSIGPPAFNLKHTIATHAGYFYGYAENTHGSIYKAYVATEQTSHHMVMRVNTGVSSADFDHIGGQYLPFEGGLSSLVRTGNTYIYTDPNGTDYRFIAESSEAHSQGRMNQIIHPNGYRIDLIRGTDASGRLHRSVRTNTGLQLKYIFEDKNFNPATLSWSRQFPKHIYALNNAYENCSDAARTCNFLYEWPKVSFDWPDNMPSSMYNTPTVFRVTDSAGKVHSYYHRPFDRTQIGNTPGSGHNVPRIVKVVDGSTSNGASTVEYEYENVTAWRSSGIFGYQTVVEPAVLKTATKNGEERRYGINNLSCTGYGCSELNKTSFGYTSLTAKVRAANGAPTEIKTENETIYLRGRGTNEVTSIVYPEGNRTSFTYDERRRLTGVTHSPRQGSERHNYTQGYVNGCPNKKTCNKAIWHEDPKGNRTHFSYHPQSGQIALIRTPQNQFGVSTEIHYTYEQKYAWYKNTNDAVVRSQNPIWLPVKEATKCIAHSSAGAAHCQAVSEVKKEYDYGVSGQPNNLFLRGISITSNDTNEIRLTCFQHDRLGNIIAETQPKANLSQCP